MPKEDEMWGTPRDPGYARPRLRKRPEFAADRAGTVARGLGATAVFLSIDGVLLGSLPGLKPGRLARTWDVNSEGVGLPLIRNTLGAT